MLMRSAWRASLPLRRLVFFVLACATGISFVTSASDVYDPEPSSPGDESSDNSPAVPSSFVGECSGEEASVQDILLEAPDPTTLYTPSAIRAQRSPFLANPQGLDYGFPIKLVNSSRGNLTFQWPDLTLPGHIPFIVGRVYDSDLARPSGRAHPACAQDFGRGWRMLPSDHILMLAGGNRLEVHGSTGRSQGFLLDASGTFVPEKDTPDIPWDRIVPVADGSLEARLPRGEVQTYRAGQEPGLYLLAERADANGHWLRLDWESDRLVRLENDGGAYIEVAREVATQAEREAVPGIPQEELAVESGSREASPDRITALIDSAGRTVTFRYDHPGRLVESVAPGGVVTRWSYDDGGRLADASDAAGRSLLSATYNRGGRVEDLVMAGGGLTFDYDAPTRVTNVRNAPGARWQMNHDPEGRFVRLIDPMAFENAFAYDGYGDLVEHRDTQGRSTRYRYSRHLVTAIEFPDGSSVARTYDAGGRLLTSTDQESSITRYSYDERGNLLTVTGALGKIRSAAYDEAGNLIELVDHAGRRTAFDHDSFGRIITVEELEGGRWLIEHDPRGPITRITGPAGESVVVEYDAAGRAIAVVTPENVTEEATYDEADLLIAYSDRSGRRFDLTYDEWRRLASVARSDAKSVGYEYDQRGLLSWIHRPGEPSTNYGYDATDLLAFVKLSPGEPVVFSYDGEGRLFEAALKGDPSIVYRFDETGRLRSRILSDGAEEKFEPLEAGHLSLRELPRQAGQLDAMLKTLGVDSLPSGGSAVRDLRVAHDLPDRLLDVPPPEPGGRSFSRNGAAGKLWLLPPDVGVHASHWYETGSQPLRVLLLLRDIKALASTGRIRGAPRDSDSGLSTETVNPIGPEIDPPVWVECPDAFGFCDAACSGSNPTCCPQCWGDGGGGGGSGGGGGDGESCTLSIIPATATTAPLSTVSFWAETSGCSATPSWTAIGGSPNSGTGTSFGVTYAAPSQVPFTVSVSADGITQSARVYVLAPQCDYSVSVSPGSPYVGDPVTLRASGNCVAYSWTGDSSACPSSGTTNQWTTRFRQVGSRNVQVSGDNGYQGFTITGLNVPVQQCSTSILGPSAIFEGESTCYSASVTGGTSGTYTWSAPGGMPGGQIGPGTSFCTTFTAPGEYVVTLAFEKSVPGCSPVLCLGASKQVTVSAIPPPTVQINSANPLALLQGENVTVSAVGLDGFGNPASGTYSWASSNIAVLAVSPNGSQVSLTASAAGTATLSVTFTTADGSDSDQITVYVVRVDSITPTGAVHIPDVIGDPAIRHFATAKGQAGDLVTIQASITPNTPAVRSLITWSGAQADPGDPLLATVGKDAVARHNVQLQVAGRTAVDARVWVIWGTGTATQTVPPHEVRLTSVTDKHVPPQTGPGSGVRVEWGDPSTIPKTPGFEFTISPSSLFTDNDRPNLSGFSTTSPPGGTHLSTGLPLSGGAQLKWDMSRRMRVRVLSPTVGTEWFNMATRGLTENLPAADIIQEDYPTYNLSLSTGLGVLGNDDIGVADEDNIPNSGGQIRSIDPPGGVVVLDAGGAVGASIEIRLHFGEFVRLEMNGVWMRVSDYLDWRFHMLLLKASEAADGQDYNGDGDLLDELWVDNGSVSDTTNTGWN